MKNIAAVLLLLAGWVVFAGMGKALDSEIPKPSVDFAATVLDDQGISTKCRFVNWEGQLFFTGARGKGIVSIPFENVKKVVFIGESVGGKKDAQVNLRGGEVVAVTFDEESRFYGTTTFGTYRITAKNVKEIIFE